MIVEIGSTILMAGLAGYSYFKTSGPAVNDAEKIQRIFANTGMNVNEGGKVKTIRLQRRTKMKGGVEYVYQLPLGLSSRQIIDKQHVLEDGLNVRQKLPTFNPQELLKIKWDKTALKQIKAIFKDKETVKKEIEIEFDGMLKIKVYTEPMPNRIDWQDSYSKPGTWAVPVGINRAGITYHDFDERKHLIVAGATGGGKSVSIKSMITCLITQNPEDTELSLIDLKGGAAFNRYKNCAQVKNYGTCNEEAAAILKDVQQRMKRQYDDVVEQGFEDVSEAGITKRHFIIIDEAADLVGDNTAMEILTDIVRKGRAAGFYVIYATQYPSAQAVPMQIKRNVPARLCFVLDSASASMTVLDTTGAEDLPETPGRGIYKGGVKKEVIQAPYMSNKQIQERIEPYINIRPRKDDQDHEQKRSEATKDRKHSIEFKEI